MTKAGLTPRRCGISPVLHCKVKVLLLCLEDVYTLSHVGVDRLCYKNIILFYLPLHIKSASAQGIKHVIRHCFTVIA